MHRLLPVLALLAALAAIGAPAAAAATAAPPRLAVLDVNRWGETMSVNATISFGSGRSGRIRVRATCGTRVLVDWRASGSFIARTSAQLAKGRCGAAGSVAIRVSFIESTAGGATWARLYRR